MNKPHTPGPWAFQERIGIGDDRSLVISKEHTIALVGHPDPDEQIANLQIITAAPELLNACAHAFMLLSGLSTDGEITMTPEGKDAILAELKSAIAKAEGTRQ